MLCQDLRCGRRIKLRIRIRIDRIYYILPYGTKINRGDCIHVYAFHADTLKKYSWEEIRTGKKYWFRETVCQSTDIQFPDGFKYMEESDAENP